MMGFGGRKPGLIVLLLIASALGTFAVAQTLPVKLLLRASEPIQPVEGTSILGRYWTSAGTRGVVHFYPVPGSGRKEWKATFPSLSNPATVDVFMFPGAFRDLSGNLNLETVHCRLSVQAGVAQSTSPSFWQLR